MSVKYTEDHEWIKVDGDVGTIGISPYAANALGDRSMRPQTVTAGF